uniref:Uncharacterized protein n=1 Tax=Strigamia maritima TaxID=126957 RepID=T1JEH8_STRMM
MVVFRGDPCGIICMFLTYLAVGYADYVVIRWIIILTMSTSLWGAINAILFNIIVFLLVMAHLRAVLTDPGIIPLPTNSLDFSDMHSEGKILLQEKARLIRLIFFFFFFSEVKIIKIVIL